MPRMWIHFALDHPIIRFLVEINNPSQYNTVFNVLADMVSRIFRNCAACSNLFSIAVLWVHGHHLWARATSV